jgi:hypothetical protein
MPLLLMLAMLAATTPPAAVPANTARGAIAATIRGTEKPLEVELLLRDESEKWKEVAHKSLPANVRHIRFEGLDSGVYQIRLRGPLDTEQMGTKVAVGKGDVRETTISVEPFALTGRVLFGETNLGEGAIHLTQRDLGWQTAIGLAADGTFRAPLWQGGEFAYEVSGPALPTPFLENVELAGKAPVLQIVIPDGRVTGILRDAKSGAPVAGATVVLQTKLELREENVPVTTSPEGRFDFTGIKYGRQTVKIYPPQHLEPEPIAFTLDTNTRLRELDVRVDPGRPVAVIVIDRENDPVANARVLAVSESKLRARTMTDEDGRATVSLPAGESATLFVIPEKGPFAMLRVAREQAPGRLQVHLPSTSSSLLIRALTTNGATMPPFSLLMRYDGELVPPAVAEELLVVQGLQLMTGADSEARLENIPSGSYEFWPYRTDDEAESIVASSAALLAPIQVNVRMGENKIAVKFAGRTR